VTAEHPESSGEGVFDGVKVTDKRRLDPLTGELRAPAPSQEPAVEGFRESAGRDGTDGSDGPTLGEVADDTIALVAEITADLQRLQAEYANYRKRVDRDRELVRATAVGGTMAELLPVLDDIGRAREHGELEGAFKSVGEALESTLGRLGLESYGVVGEPFDPTVHEALTHVHSDDVVEATCVAIYQPGYRYAGRVVRPARVGVGDPN
jgi:molecular chaperone GrpE